MNKKLLVIQVAALSHAFDLEGLQSETLQSVFPAVTCTVQASFRTATPPSAHGMVANGLFYRNLNRPMFWEQSAGLVEGRRIWHNFRSRGKRVGLLFWQQSLGENADIILSPAPIHKHHGGMIQDCYSQPSKLYRKLCKSIGRPFNLRHYWGPQASWRVGEWILAATRSVLKDPQMAPDLCLTYLPTLDYDLQRNDPTNSRASETARIKVNAQLSRLIRTAGEQGFEILVYGDYHMAPVAGAVLPNLALREAGMMSVRPVKGRLYPDFYGSRAFAVVDHEIAHVYIPAAGDMDAVKDILRALPGVADVLDRSALSAADLQHDNTGELVVVARRGHWFAYPWWKQRGEAPDFATHVDIHNKPGFDPCELHWGWPPGSVSRNPMRIRGSHGRTGRGREVTWATTLGLKTRPRNLIDLAVAVRDWLDEGVQCNP